MLIILLKWHCILQNDRNFKIFFYTQKNRGLPLFFLANFSLLWYHMKHTKEFFEVYIIVS